ncbi:MULTISPECIES: DUF3139 domain-containing protein [Staphylococcus]|nr:DUF3139 domain-containing protein [Staphylococcus epidermidis]MCG2286417.1 DUF3139 domain-containing protein [Staphylococcus epidermidis]MCO6200705.1 DUF3139 domain-containing protein [Staphylococcus epidermidis]MDH8856097.1 DUF3139 domain-containing protein [Staphylococcus epidermidis]MDU1382915.1 DUF3139 domain-containing protein [Staphylococcus epidermidis]NAN96172.1 DUF3139 domain-containing protein [Staphylococcus epidermidis]
MNKILKILITSIIVIIITLTVWTFSVITYQKHKSEKIINHVIERKGWDKKIKNEKMSFNIMMGYAEKDIVFKDQPYSEYEYNVTPAPAPWTDDKEYKVWGETDLQKKDSYYKYLLESEPYRK